VAARGISTQLRAFWLGLAVCLSACATAAAPTPLPTLTLIPPTATYTPTPVTPTSTLIRLPGPADLSTPTPDSGPLLIPAVAQPLLQRALDDLAERVSVDANAIRIVRLEAAVWTSLDLGCGEEMLEGTAVPEIEGFRFVLQAVGQMYEYHADARSSVRLCDEVGTIAGRTENLLLEADPVAADMVWLARRRLATQLDLPVIRIRVIDVMPVTWTDSSLGCPQPDQIYPPVTIEGYRIVLAAGDEEHIFHSDSTQVLPCQAGNERLPLAE
jgi:hypothetical protein